MKKVYCDLCGTDEGVISSVTIEQNGRADIHYDACSKCLHNIFKQVVSVKRKLGLPQTGDGTNGN
jgi:hypothetical protein